MDYFRTLTLLPKLYHNTGKENEKEGTWCIVGQLLPASGIFVDIEIYEKFKITCDFVVNIL